MCTHCRRDSTRQLSRVGGVYWAECSDRCVLCCTAGSPSSVGARLDIDEAELSRIDELLDSIFTPTPVELVKIVLYRRHRRRGILRTRDTGTGNRTRGDGAETGSRMDSVCMPWCCLI